MTTDANKPYLARARFIGPRRSSAQHRGWDDARIKEERRVRFILVKQG